VIADNILTVDRGGQCTLAMDIRGFGAVVTGNNIHTGAADAPLRVMISGGNTLITSNCFENVVLEVDDKTGGNKPIVINNNLLENARILHKTGKLLTTVIAAESQTQTTAPSQ
jgi:hypothetical protein